MTSRRTVLLGAGALAAQSKALPFEYWDVFTSTRFKGNPLAVFTNAGNLEAEQMSAIARETNLSETTFIFRRSAAEEREKGVRTRIFTPVTEYDFAGHPTLGTAMSLWTKGTSRIVLHLNVGPVPVDFKVEKGKVFGMMTQPKPVFAEDHNPEIIAKLIGAAAGEITGPITNVSTGRPNLIVMLKHLKTLQSLRPNWPAITDYFATGDTARGFYFLCPEVEDSSAAFHARKLTPRTEDPVTGSAAGSAIAYLVRNKLVPAGKQIIIEQGSEVKRRGELYVSAEGENVRVGGYAVKVWTGTLDLG